MKRTILPSFILFISIMIPLPAFSQWKNIFSTEEAGFYFNDDSIKRRSGFVYWWDLVNYNYKQRQGHRSWKTYNQGDCESYRVKTTKSLFYDQKWGEGNLLNLRSARKLNKWRYLNPKNMDYSLLKKICTYWLALIICKVIFLMRFN